jgi:hypothetical protein
MGISAYSEAPFIALLVATILLLELAIERPAQRRWLLLAGLAAGSSVALRYSGLFFVGMAGAILLTARPRAASLAVRARRAALFGLAAAVVPAAVVVRNLHLDGRPFGPRLDPYFSVAELVTDTLTAMKWWLLPPDASRTLRVLLAVALAALAVGVILTWARGARSGARGGGAPTGRRPGPALWPLALMAGGYVAFLIAYGTLALVGPIDERFLAPAFVPAAVLALAGADRLVARRAPPVVLAACAAVILAWLGVQASASRAQLTQLRHDGLVYTSVYWRESPLIALARRHRPAFTNQTDALYFVTSIRASCWPSQGLTVCSGRGPDLERLRSGAPAYMAWFTQQGRTRPYVPPALRSQVRMTPVAIVADGGLYRVRLRDPDRPTP